MTETSPNEAPTAGAMLRAAREKQGLHIAALSASIKVTKEKLEALENDRYEELPDMTFTRALAKTVCRALKIDAEPVLAKLPIANGYRLEPIGGGLNEPFRESGARREPSDWHFVGKPVFWSVGAMLVAAAVLYLLPDDMLRGVREAASGAASAPSASAPVPVPLEPTPASSPLMQAPASAPETSLPETSRANAVPEIAPASAAVVEAASMPPVPPASAAAAAAASIAVVRAGDPSWVEVVDASGKVLLSRTLAAGEEVGLDGALPLRVKIGNASGTALTFRGRPIDLAPSTRDNVARLDLK